MIRGFFAFLLLALFLNTGLVYAGAFIPAERAKKSADNTASEANRKDKGIEDFRSSRKLIYEKMIKRTNEYKDELDNMFLMVNNLYRQAEAGKDMLKQKELVEVMSDYNSVLGDVGLMQVILELGKFADEGRFLDYYIIMENGFERLKGSFSLKNEIFLNRVDKGLKTPDALRYEKKLSRIYREYFEYDPKIDNIEASKEAVMSKEKNLKEKGR